jgi:hypothetical protein
MSKIASVISELTGMECPWNDSDSGKPKYSKRPSAAGLEFNPGLRRERPAWAALRYGISHPSTIIIVRDTVPRRASLMYSDQPECIHPD